MKTKEKTLLRKKQRREKKDYFEIHNAQFNFSYGWDFVPFDELDACTSELVKKNSDALKKRGF